MKEKVLGKSLFDLKMYMLNINTIQECLINAELIYQRKCVNNNVKCQ